LFIQLYAVEQIPQLNVPPQLLEIVPQFLLNEEQLFGMQEGIHCPPSVVLQVYPVEQFPQLTRTPQIVGVPH
jgi:hypothetical protein